MSVVCLVALAQGEKIIPGAQTIDIGGGLQHLPQHYVSYQHTLQSVEAILSRITFSDEVLLFAGHDNNGLYIQVGVIGQENYQVDNMTYPPKIVYGRRWRIDADTSSSEIVQTAMLAIKKVREHEVRELFVWHEEGHKTSVPLSSHQDINMLKKAASYEVNLLQSNDNDTFDETLQRTLHAIRFLGKKVRIKNTIIIDSKRTLVDFTLQDTSLTASVNDTFHEFEGVTVSLLLDAENISTLAYMLLDSFIAHSDRFVEEIFAYESFNRFSRRYSPRWIAEQSRKSRPYKKHMADLTFKQTFQDTNFNTDESRKPELGSGLLADINNAKLVNYPDLTGHLPWEFKSASSKQAM